MKYLSFSLWGNDPKYINGMMRNAELAPIVFPGWKVLCYVDCTVPGDVLDQLCRLGVTIIYTGRTIALSGYFWRFLANDIADCGTWISQDADSRLNWRMRKAVDIWTARQEEVMVVRDHPNHLEQIMAGLWGAKRGAISDMQRLIEAENITGSRYQDDQEWLSKVIWPKVARSALQLDLCEGTRKKFGGESFPCTLGDWRFAGERFDENDQPFKYEWEMRINYMIPLQ